MEEKDYMVMAAVMFLITTLSICNNLNSRRHFYAYQEKRKNHEDEEPSIVPSSYTIVEPLQRTKHNIIILYTQERRTEHNNQKSYSAVMIKSINTFVANPTVLTILQNLYEIQTTFIQHRAVK